MNKFAFVVHQNIEDCKSKLMSSSPSFFESYKRTGFNIIKGNICGYKSKKDKLAIVSQGFSYPPIILRFNFIKLGETETELIGKFSKNIFMRLIIWIVTAMMFFFSFLYIIAVLKGVPSIESNASTNFIPALVLIISISYLIHTERARAKEKRRLQVLVSGWFNK